jgi:hypothetical protein
MRFVAPYYCPYCMSESKETGLTIFKDNIGILEEQVCLNCQGYFYTL